MEEFKRADQPDLIANEPVVEYGLNKDSSIDITDMYMSVLSYLKDTDKLKLIEKLKKSLSSIVERRESKKDWCTGFSEDWGEGMSAIEYANSLRHNSFNDRNVPNW